MIDDEKVTLWLLARFPRPMVVILRILGAALIVGCFATAMVIYMFVPGTLVAAATQNVAIGIAVGSVWLMLHLAIFIHYEDVETWLNKTYPPRKVKDD